MGGGRIEQLAGTFAMAQWRMKPGRRQMATNLGGHLFELFDRFGISGQLLRAALNWFEIVMMRNRLFVYESGRAQKVH